MGGFRQLLCHTARPDIAAVRRPSALGAGSSPFCTCNQDAGHKRSKILRRAWWHSKLCTRSLPKEVATLCCRRVVEPQLLLQDFSQDLQFVRLKLQAARATQLYGPYTTASNIPRNFERSLPASAVGGASSSLRRYPQSFLASRGGTGVAVYRLPASRDCFERWRALLLILPPYGSLGAPQMACRIATNLLKLEEGALAGEGKALEATEVRHNCHTRLCAF